MNVIECPVVVYFDGACEPQNPGGWMSWAWVALGADGQEISHRAYVERPAPTNTNNVAEYRAVIAALGWLRDHGFAGVHVRGDSQLVIKQLLGEYRVNSPTLLGLYQEASALVATTAPRLKWVRREINHRADAYSRMALPADVIHWSRR